jgi:integrase
MPVLSLTDRFCKLAKPGPEAFDETVKGLALRVSSGGHKAWAFHFTIDGKRARCTIGSYPATSLAKARTTALEARGYVEEGKDPRRIFGAVEASNAMTVADLADSYIEKHVRPNLKSARHMELRLKANVKPVIGNVRLADLHRRDANRVLDKIIARGKPTQARLVFQDMRAIFRWAVARGDLDRNPIEGMEKPGIERARDRVLSDDEIRHVWHSLDTALAGSPYVREIIKLCIVTGQRVGEVTGLTRDELDLPARLWNLPAVRSKNGHAHSVPLSDLAMEIIEGAQADGPRLFPMTSLAVARAIARAQADFGLPRWTAHDLRRTALTGMAKLGVSPTVIGHVANHRTTTHGGITLAVYIHYAHDKEKRHALDLWADRLRAIVAGRGAKIIPMEAAKS